MPSKSTPSIDKEYRSLLESLIKTAKTELMLEKAEDKKAAKIAENFEKLKAEADRLEQSFDGANLEELERLTNKKSQVSLMAAKMKEFGEDGTVNSARAATYHKLMLEMNEAFHTFYEEFDAALRQKITSAFRVFYENDHFLEGFVRQTHAVNRLNYWRSSFISAHDPKPCVLGLIQVFEQILAGEEIWTFDPKL